MNTEVYEKLQAAVPDFEKKFTAVVPVGQIVYDKGKSQPRAHGHVTANVPRLKEVITSRGPKAVPPISTRKLANGKYELVDGNTRALAAEEGLGKVWITWYHDEVEKPTPEEWQRKQMEWNDHRKAAPSSDDDIKAYLCREQSSGYIQHKVGFPYQQDEELFIETAIDIYRKILPNSGRTKKWWRSAVATALKGNIARAYENYTKNQLFNIYCTLKGFAGTKIGEVSNGKVVFPFRTPNERNPGVIGSIASKRMDNQGVTYTLVYCVSKLAGKNDQSIFDERKATIAWAKKVNTHYPGFIDALYFAPQIKSGKNKENMFQLIEAKL